MRLALERGDVHRQALEPYVYGVRCTAGVGVIGKPVAGVPGDTVEVRREGVWINGVRLAQGAVRDRDRAGRALPHAGWGRRVLGPGEFWLQSTCRRGRSTAGTMVQYTCDRSAISGDPLS